MQPLSSDEVSRLNPEERLVLIRQLWESLKLEDVTPSALAKAGLSPEVLGSDKKEVSTITWEQLRSELTRRKAEAQQKALQPKQPAARNIGGIIGPY